MTLSNRLLALKARALALSPHVVPATAADILAKSERYGDVTDRQHAYVDSMLRTAEGGPRSARSPLDLKRINAMFDTAAANLKRPFVNFLVDGREFRLSQAPATGKNPGSLYLKAGGTYAGKVSPEGAFSPAREAPAGLVEALAAFAANPTAAALAYGQATGVCCFCARALTDARSVEVGYGPICASRWGLPWGVACEEVA